MLDQSILPSFAWPLAMVVLGMVFMWLFRDQIGRFIDRTKSVSKEGVRAYDESQLSAKKPGALTEFFESYHSSLLLEVESAIEKDFRDQGLTDPTDVRKALVKRLAGAVIWGQFEALQSSIFASQIEALMLLNGVPQPIPKTDLEAFIYDKAATNFPEWHENRTFDQWFEFLRAQVLVVEAEAGVNISVRGREFLKWRIEQGRSGPWFG